MPVSAATVSRRMRPRRQRSRLGLCNNKLLVVSISFLPKGLTCGKREDRPEKKSSKRSRKSDKCLSSVLSDFEGFTTLE